MEKQLQKMIVTAFFLPLFITAAAHSAAGRAANANKAPAGTIAARAGDDQKVLAGTVVSLDGRGSFDKTGTIEGYAWEQIAGTTVLLTGSATPKPSFTAPAGGGTLIFRMTVTNDKGVSASDTVDVIVIPAAADASLTASPADTQLAGKPVVFTAAGLGGSGSYEYQFWMKPAAAPTLAKVRDYAKSGTWSWDTAGTSPGAYLVQVRVRNTGSTSHFEALKTVNYVIAEPQGRR